MGMWFRIQFGNQVVLGSIVYYILYYVFFPYFWKCREDNDECLKILKYSVEGKNYEFLKMRKYFIIKKMINFFKKKNGIYYAVKK